jgi:gamma-glutamylcyclotransferase (GGCT)/AIG2-like uncharacterized protein YtfP
MAGLCRHLFVYGTLRQRLGHPMSRLLGTHARLTGEGAILARLYNVGAYPAAVLAGEGRSQVRGEVYALDRLGLVLAVLDRYEDCAPSDGAAALYVRREADVRMAHGGHLRAWVYLYNRDAGDLPRIPGGDYAAHALRSRPKRRP